MLIVAAVYTQGKTFVRRLYLVVHGVCFPGVGHWQPWRSLRWPGCQLDVAIVA